MIVYFDEIEFEKAEKAEAKAAAKQAKKDAKAAEKDLINQYGKSNDSNKRKIQDEIKSYVKAIEALGEYKRIKEKKYTEAQINGVAAAAGECYNCRARLSWYLNIVNTNYRNHAALLESTSPKKAMKLRVEAGKYRAKMMAEIAKHEKQEKDVLKHIPDSVLPKT